MPIPDIEVFNEFLSSLTLTQPADQSDFESLEIVPSRRLSDSSGPFSTEPIRIWYRRSCKLSPTSLIERLGKELDHQGHLSTPEMAKLLLGMTCLTAYSSESPTKCLNSIVAMIGPAESSQFWIEAIPPPPDSCSFRLGRFTIGPLNRQRLMYWCEKVECDFLIGIRMSSPIDLPLKEQPFS